MAGTVVATAQPGNEPPRSQIDLSGFTGAATAVVTRIDSRGVRTPIRTGYPATLSGGGITIFDYEAPFLSACSYEADPSTGDTVTSNAVTIDSPVSWLVHPGVPSLSIRVSQLWFGEDETDDVNTGTHWPLGGDAPIIITDGVRHVPAFELTIRTDTQAETDAVDAIVADTSVLLLREAYDWTAYRDYRWLSFGPKTKRHRSYDRSDPARNFTFPVQEAGAPSGLQQAQFTWADARAAYPTWREFINAFPTWRDSLANHPAQT